MTRPSRAFCALTPCKRSQSAWQATARFRCQTSAQPGRFSKIRTHPRVLPLSTRIRWQLLAGSACPPTAFPTASSAISAVLPRAAGSKGRTRERSMQRSGLLPRIHTLAGLDRCCVCLVDLRVCNVFRDSFRNSSPTCKTVVEDKTLLLTPFTYDKHRARPRWARAKSLRKPSAAVAMQNARACGADGHGRVEEVKDLD